MLLLPLKSHQNYSVEKLLDNSVILMKKMKVVASEEHETKRYSYIHFNMSGNKVMSNKLLEYIRREEFGECFIDYINRINKRTNTTRKIIVITKDFLFLFNLDGSPKKNTRF